MSHGSTFAPIVFLLDDRSLIAASSNNMAALSTMEALTQDVGRLNEALGPEKTSSEPCLAISSKISFPAIPVSTGTQTRVKERVLAFSNYFGTG